MNTASDDRPAGFRGRNADEDAETYRYMVDAAIRRRKTKTEAINRLLTLVADRNLVMPQIITFTFSDDVDVQFDCPDRDTFRAVVRAIGSTIDNPWNKSTSGGRYRLERRDGDLTFEIVAAWGTCEQVQVGTQVKTTTEVVQPAVTREVVSEVPVFEWQCPDSLLLGELDAAVDESVAAEIGAG